LAQGIISTAIEVVLALGEILDVGVDEERICFGVDVFHHDLEAIEAVSPGPCWRNILVDFH
jgi:hypothetical protein